MITMAKATRGADSIQQIVLMDLGGSSHTSNADTTSSCGLDRSDCKTFEHRTVSPARSGDTEQEAEAAARAIRNARVAVNV